mgnify:CR=1 FL=1
MSQKSHLGSYRKEIELGQLVKIVQKQHQQSGELTEGLVKRILTNAPHHHHGIKVALDTGEIGRVKEIIDIEDIDWAKYS